MWSGISKLITTFNDNSKNTKLKNEKVVVSLKSFLLPSVPKKKWQLGGDFYI
jgi:hypothetical protein